MIYKAYLFDWGDTLMVDLPGYSGPMKSWPEVKAVEGARKTLEYLSKVSMCHLVTNAKDSYEDDIREALARVNLDVYLSRIFCYRNVGFEKPSREFFSKVMESLGLAPKDIALVGDSFEKDILGAISNGIYSFWYNPLNAEVKEGKMYSTIHSLVELIDLAKEFAGFKEDYPKSDST
jgi:putative hydrolase of the HAD superfamily